VVEDNRGESGGSSFTEVVNVEQVVEDHQGESGESRFTEVVDVEQVVDDHRGAKWWGKVYRGGGCGIGGSWTTEERVVRRGLQRCWMWNRW